MWRLLGSPLSAQTVVERSLRGAVESDPRRRSDRRAAFVRARAQIRRTAVGQSGAAGFSRAAGDGPRHGRAARPGVRDARAVRIGSVSSGGRRRQRRTDARSRRSTWPGLGRDHALDALAGALAIPVATEPHLAAFSPEGAWRGETHRVCDRPGALTRLLEEVALAGAEQVILVSASPPPGRAHELKAGRGDLRGPRRRAARRLRGCGSSRRAASSSTAVSPAFSSSVPATIPLGPLDFGGVYDERSDRTLPLAELTDRGYGDAYRQFIEPVVGAGGERIEAVQPGNGGAGRNVQL